MNLRHMQKEHKWSADTQFKTAREALNYWAEIAVLNHFTKRRLAFDVQWSGPMPAGPKIFAGNHPTTTDPFYVLAVVGEKMRMMVNADIFSTPILGRLMRKGGHIPVDKANGIKSLESGIEALSQGENIGIFPEGSLSDLSNGIGVNRLKTGAVRMAMQSGAPLLPIGIHLPLENIRIRNLKVGGEKVESRFYLKGRYAITIGQPMYVSGNVENREHVRELTAMLQERIYALSQISAMRLKKESPKVSGRRKKRKSIMVESGM